MEAYLGLAESKKMPFNKIHVQVFAMYKMGVSWRVYPRCQRFMAGLSNSHMDAS